MGTVGPSRDRYACRGSAAGSRAGRSGRDRRPGLAWQVRSGAAAGVGLAGRRDGWPCCGRWPWPGSPGRMGTVGSSRDRYACRGSAAGCRAGRSGRDRRPGLAWQVRSGAAAGVGLAGRRDGWPCCGRWSWPGSPGRMGTAGPSGDRYACRGSAAGSRAGRSGRNRQPRRNRQPGSGPSARVGTVGPGRAGTSGRDRQPCRDRCPRTGAVVTGGRGQFCAAATRSRAMSVIMSSWPPTMPRRPASTRIERVSRPYRAAAVSACRRKLEYTPA